MSFFQGFVFGFLMALMLVAGINKGGGI